MRLNLPCVAESWFILKSLIFRSFPNIGKHQIWHLFKITRLIEYWVAEMNINKQQSGERWIDLDAVRAVDMHCETQQNNINLISYSFLSNVFWFPFKTMISPILFRLPFLTVMSWFESVYSLWLNLRYEEI